MFPISFYDYLIMFPRSHYPISRKGPDSSSGTAILLVCAEENRPGLQENIQYMETFLRGLNLRINHIRIDTPLGLGSALSVITKPELERSNYTEVLPDNIWNARILREDSLCFIGVIANGNYSYSQLSKGAYVTDVNIEEFFNEDYCLLLRGKPKLFLYFKYYLELKDGTKTVDLINASASPHTGGINWRNPITSTNLNFLSFYTYEFGISALQTESHGSTALHTLQTAYRRNPTDALTFFREFFNEMVELQSQLKIKKHRLPCICLMGRYRMRSPLFFLQPQHEYSHEEQDWENDLDETLSNYSGLSLTPRATTPQAGFRVEQKPYCSTHPPTNNPPTRYWLNTYTKPRTNSTSFKSVQNSGKIPFIPQRKPRNYNYKKKFDVSHSHQYYNNTYTNPQRMYITNPQKNSFKTQPGRYDLDRTNKQTNQKRKRWKKRMRVKRNRTKRFDKQNKRFDCFVTGSGLVSNNTI